ncbi:MAG: SRPBCC family protein [Armatimonadota bacterium]|nr:SRPBCC family protein [Armatimonadota bacterium]MDR7536278.1 SRPBCC family protein [Armatimonadota bacterium]
MTRDVGVEGHRRIRAPVQRVWQLLARLESLPRYSSLWMAADVLERSGTTALVEFRGFLGGLPVTSLQRVTLRAPSRLEFRQVRGELLQLSGSITLREADGETDVRYQIAVEPGIPLFTEASVLQILAAHTDVLLARLKAAAERDLVRVVVRRRAGAPAAGALAGLEPEAEADDEETDQAPAAPEAATAAGDQEADRAGAAQMAGAPADAAQATAPAPSGEGTPRGPGDQRRRRRRRRRRRHAPPRQPAGPQPPP